MPPIVGCMRLFSPLAVCILIMLSGCIPHVGNSPAPFMAVAREGDRLEMFHFACQDELLHEVTVQRIDEVLAGGVVNGPVLWQVRSTKGVATDRVILGETPSGFEVTVPLNSQLPLDRDISVSMRTSRFEETGVDVFTPSELRSDEVRVYYSEMPRQEFEAQTFDC
jgi:hypothetical protein